MFIITSISPNLAQTNLSVSSYFLHVISNGVRKEYWAEVRPGNNVDQIDWAEELHDLFLEHDVLATDYGRISDIIHMIHCNLTVQFPVSFGAA
jgi:hypothetical protein